VPAALGVEPPPEETLAIVAQINAALDRPAPEGIPGKALDDNLLIATWNIRHFGRVTNRWLASAGDDPKRTLHDVLCLAQIISRFDVVAIQEVKRDLDALRMLMLFLGPDWGFIVTDVTEGTPGNSERLGFVFDLRRVRPSGLAGELVLPGGAAEGAAVREQFARTPFSVSFRAGVDVFTLMTLHVVYGTADRPEDRTPELTAFAEWLAARADDRDQFGRNLMALGDFNIDRRDDPNWLAFASTGLGAPVELEDVPRTIKRSEGSKFYDQIAWFGKGRRKLRLGYRTAGFVKWTDLLLTDLDEPEKAARISDHYPLWAEFALSDS
jgi:hypothetical protein